jgi:transposase
MARRRKENRRPLPRQSGWRDVPDAFWEKVAPLIPDDPRSPKGGHPPTAHRTIFNGILYVLRTGCQWKMMPREYKSSSVAHDHFQKWVRAGIFAKLWKQCLAEYDDVKGIDWEWQTVDSVTVSAPVKRGIVQGKTRRIGANKEPSGICMLTGAESLLG